MKTFIYEVIYWGLKAVLRFNTGDSRINILKAAEEAVEAAEYGRTYNRFFDKALDLYKTTGSEVEIPSEWLNSAKAMRYRFAIQRIKSIGY